MTTGKVADRALALMVATLVLAACAASPGTGKVASEPSADPATDPSRAVEVTKIVELEAEAGGTIDSTISPQAVTTTVPAVPAAAPTPTARVTGATVESVVIPEGLTATEVIVYVPTLPDTAAEADAEAEAEAEADPWQEGACWTNALSVANPHAWRCAIDSSEGVGTANSAVGDVFDPCFEVPGDSRVLICEPNPLTGDPGFPLVLTEPLPAPEQTFVAATTPWLVALPDGTQCNLATGATGNIANERVSYLCGDQTEGAKVRRVLLGDLKQGLVSDDAAAGTFWGAQEAVLEIGDDTVTVVSSSWVALPTIVQGPFAFTPIDCGGLARDAAPLFGTAAMTATTSFEDHVYGNRGRACEVRLTGDGTRFSNHVDTADLARAYFADQGWDEDLAYLGAGPTGEVTAFRREGGLCLLDVSWEPIPPATCPEDEPLGFCELAPEERATTLALACARDIYAPRPPVGGYALSTDWPARVTFEQGGTGATWDGTVARGEVTRYIFTAMAGQPALVEVVPSTPLTPTDVVGLSIVIAPEGTPLLDADANRLRWTGILPGTHDYVVRIAGRKAAVLTARLVIPDIVQAEPAGPLTLTGEVAPDATRHILLQGASTGQKARIRLDVSAGEAGLALSGWDDGTVLLDRDDAAVHWSGAFPTGQDTLIEVIAGDEGATYDLEIRTDR